MRWSDFKALCAGRLFRKVRDTHQNPVPDATTLQGETQEASVPLPSSGDDIPHQNPATDTAAYHNTTQKNCRFTFFMWDFKSSPACRD